MKKLILIITNIMVICMLTLGMSGCGKINNESQEVKNLQHDLINFAKESSEKYFAKTIDEKKFDISMGKESRPNEFDSIDNIKDVKECYLSGHVNGKPDDILSFVLVYNVQDKKITKFGIQTLKDDNTVFANLDK